mmetsp:Transcript_3278/g.4521  ORF Transcript_3278/g.4521 Transcript_3278/m.4521 type:complete len:270 (-) Transcript_3278:14-823(-)
MTTFPSSKYNFFSRIKRSTNTMKTQFNEYTKHLWKHLFLTSVILISSCSLITASTNEEGSRTLGGGMMFNIKITGPFVLTYSIFSVNGDFDVFLFDDNEFNEWFNGTETHYMGYGKATQLNVTVAVVDDYEVSHGGTHWLVLYNEPTSETVDLYYEIKIDDYTDNDYKLIFEVGIGLMSAITLITFCGFYFCYRFCMRKENAGKRVYVSFRNSDFNALLPVTERRFLQQYQSPKGPKEGQAKPYKYSPVPGSPQPASNSNKQKRNDSNV